MLFIIYKKNTLFVENKSLLTVFSITQKKKQGLRPPYNQ